MVKDWKGGSSIIHTNTRKDRSVVKNEDFYATHPESVKTFIKRFFKDFTRDLTFWECACGKGHISNILRRAGLKGISTDLIDRGYEHMHKRVNFLKATKCPKSVNCIITNPPYFIAEDFVLHALSFDVDYVIMYMKLTFLETKDRYYNLFSNENKPNYVYLHSSRQGCSAKGEKTFRNGGAAAYAWYVWEREPTQDTIFRWLEPN